MTDERRTRKEWATLAIAVFVLTAVCLLAAQWQWHRYNSREAAIAVVESNYTAAPVALEELVSGPGAELQDEDVWRLATVTGNYDPDRTVLLRNRPVGGTPGFHVLVPFEVTQGSAAGSVLIVDRGFVTWGEDSVTPSEIPAPPSGEVTVTGHLRDDESPSDRNAPDHQVQAISTQQVLDAAPGGGDWAQGHTTGAYIAVTAEDPEPSTSLVPVPEPDTSPGSHLSYTVQWLIFAVGAITGFILLVRRERGPSVVAGDLRLAGEDSKAPSRPRRYRDEDDEDAEINASLSGSDDPQARDTSSV